MAGLWTSQVYKFINGVYMIEISAEAHAIYDASMLARKRAQELVDEMFAKANQETIDEIRNCVLFSNIRLWDFYEEPFDNSQESRYNILRELGFQPETMPIFGLFTVINEYEVAHMDEWHKQVRLYVTSG